MMQRALDAAVLGVFALLYSCAVLLLKLRPRKPPAPADAAEKE